jgi:primosomal protein N' (replication factor Y)
LVNLRIEGTSQKESLRAAEEIGEWGRRLLEERFSGKGIEILGPSPAPLVKLKGRYRYQMLVKGVRANPLHRFVAELAGESKERWRGKGINLNIDVDPISVM